MRYQDRPAAAHAIRGKFFRRTGRPKVHNRLTNQTTAFAPHHAITQNSGLEGEYQSETPRVKPEFPLTSDIFRCGSGGWVPG
ncbi:hypothetical protein Poly24_09310 [Rosistilla carotiformis]|uniref:Uncharacterized protein n=1 Tax=Rosistilla carotiformis TaxID=2528017 RepID=A0A518JNZ1_9BACT|nr:hypothetical protein Poly24_09310 [Rosistilla carotiformis]